jgi:hypothetical protein
VIIYDSTDISTAVQTFNFRYQTLSAEGLPTLLSLRRVVINGPHGGAFMVIFTWRSDDEEKGRKYLDNVAALGTPVMNTVVTTTIHQWLEGLAAMIPSSAYGSPDTISVRKLNPDVTAIKGRNLELVPSYSGCGFAIS